LPKNDNNHIVIIVNSIDPYFYHAIKYLNVFAKIWIMETDDFEFSNDWLSGVGLAI